MHYPSSSTYLQEPQKRPGSSIPIFERLVNIDSENVAERPVQKFYDAAGIKRSIERELWHLLGTYVKIRKEDYLELCKDPLNYALAGMYGIPELSFFEGTNTENWKPFAAHTAKVIGIFEPRLKNISMRIKGVDKQKQFLDVDIAADIMTGQFQEEVTFSMKMRAT